MQKVSSYKEICHLSWISEKAWRNLTQPCQPCAKSSVWKKSGYPFGLKVKLFETQLSNLDHTNSYDYDTLCNSPVFYTYSSFSGDVH